MRKIAFTIADKNNLFYAKQMENSLRKFHSEDDLPLYVLTGEELEGYIANDKSFFYRATPILAKRFMDEGYDFVLKLDADQYIMGDLSYLWECVSLYDYDIGVVLNINRVDPPKFGFITLLSIPANRYYNNGFVAMRNKGFVNHWHKLCLSGLFNGMPMAEQGILNILCHFGSYNVKCFDDYDPISNYYCWHGLVAKGEGVHMKVVNGEVILPVGEDNYPDKGLKIKVWHYAGGGYDSKSPRIWFNEEMIRHVEWLTSDNGKKA